MNYALGGSILALLGTIVVAAVTAWQARKGAKDSPYSALAERVTAQEKRIDELEDEVRNAKRDAEQSRRMAELAVAQEADVVDHHLAVVWQVSEDTGYPFRTRVVIPHSLRHRLTLDDYPPTPEPDTGTPGVH